jgi:hypothetical protein
VGIRNPRRLVEEEERPPGEPSRAADRVDKVPEGVPCLPVPQPTALPKDPRMQHHEMP